MTKHLLFSVLFFCFCLANAQQKMTVTFKDGTQKTGMYKIRTGTFSNSSSSTMLVSKSPNEKINLDGFASVLVYAEDKELQYVVIDVKTNFNDKKTEKKLGLLAYAGPKISMYYVAETIGTGRSFGGPGGVSVGGPVGVSFNSDSDNTYLQKANEKIAYNMGYIYGAGPRGIKKRVRDFFADCPSLVQMVDNDEIDKKETLEMVKFYESNCGL